MRTLPLTAIILALIALMYGCSPSSETLTEDYVLPTELKDCKIYWLSNGLSGMKVMRCGNSTTSLSYQRHSGKTHSTITTVTIDNEKRECNLK